MRSCGGGRDESRRLGARTTATGHFVRRTSRQNRRDGPNRSRRGLHGPPRWRASAYVLRSAGPLPRERRELAPHRRSRMKARHDRTTVVVVVRSSRRTLAVREAKGPRSARSWIRTNRETFRSALESSERCVVAILFDGRMRPFELVEFDQTWGSDGTTHTGFQTVRSMLSAHHRNLKTTEEKERP